MTKSAKNRQCHSRKPEARKDMVKREFTDEEKAMVARYLERSKRGAVKFKSVKTSSSELMYDTTDEVLGMARIMEAFGTSEEGLQRYFLNQAIQTYKGSVSSDGFDYTRVEEFANNAMALLNGIHPQDEIEGMLAIQMIAVHNMAMETMKLAMITNQHPQWIESNLNHATKMLRTFAAQMEALKRYRTGGQQKVTVEHVHVTAGGQAIVGVVNRGEGNSGKQGQTPSKTAWLVEKR